MRNRPEHTALRRGFSMIEALVASLIVGMSLAAMVSTWYVAFNMSTSTNDQGIACNLARQTIEQIKGTGFSNTAEAPAVSPVVHYFDGNQGNQDATPTAARYKVSTTVISSATIAGSNPTLPDNFALRTVTVTVTLSAKGTVLCQYVTYLTRGGI